MGDAMRSPERPGQNPNVLQSSSFEPNKGTILGTTTTPTRPPHSNNAGGDVFYQPARPIPVERPKRVEPPPNRKGLRQKIALILGSAAIAAAGVGLASVYRDQIMSSVLDTTNIVAGRTHKELPTLETFSNPNSTEIITAKAGVNAISTTVQEANSLSRKGMVKQPTIKNVEIDSTTTRIDQAPGTITALFPVKLQDKDYVETRSEYSKSMTSIIYAPNDKDLQNPVGKRLRPALPMYNEIALFNAKGREVSAGMLEGIGKVKDIMVFRNPPYIAQENGVPYFKGVTVRFVTEEGPLFDVKIRPSDNDLRQLDPLDIVKNAPILPEKLAREGNPIQWTSEDADRKGVSVTPDTSLLKTAFDNTRIAYSITEILPDNPIGQQFVVLGNIKWSVNNNNNKLQYLHP